MLNVFVSCDRIVIGFCFRMPVQYVIEEWDFRDLTLKMRPPVFIPRPETEVKEIIETLQIRTNMLLNLNVYKHPQT